MDTDALRWFQQVADGVTVTEVADLEQASQSGVSRALARLEHEVGTPLLQRHGRVLRMTRAGATFKRHVDKLLHDLDDGLAALAELADPDTGTVALAFQPSLGTWLVPELIASFRAGYPRVDFELRQIREEAPGSLLAEGSSDLELTTQRSLAAGVWWRPLLTQPLRLAVAAGHRLARGGPLDLAEARDEPFAMLRDESGTSAVRRSAVELCERAGFEPRVDFEGDDLSAVTGLVAAGLGVAIVPVPLGRPSRAEIAGAVAYRAIADPQATRQIGVAWATERRLLPAAANFRHHVVSHVATAFRSTVEQ